MLEKLGLRNPHTATEVSKWFHEVKNPLDFANLQGKEPEMFQLGEIVGETFGGLKGAKTINGIKKYLPTSGLASALIKGTATELGVEPSLDKVLSK